MAGPPGYGRPSSRPTLSNASPAASSTVWPEQAVAQVVAHLDEERVAAADDERHERELGRRPLRLVGVEQPGGVDVALEVVDRHERQAVRPGQRLGHRDAHEQRAREARALGHRDGVERPTSPSRPARSRASSRTGIIQRRWARAATSGTMPPVARVERDLAGDDVGDDAPAALDDRHGRLVAGGLDGQDAAAQRPALAHRARAPRAGRRHVGRVVGRASPP